MITYLGALAAEINPDDVTPGVIGFGFTAIFAAAIIFIGRDLYKRIRRLRYREEIRAEIAEELANKEATDSDPQEN